MKIGEFAAKNQISPDTVRYYVREGLLYPVREGYHFSFDEQCSRDLRRVQTLKNIGFSLSEIKQIMLNSTERLFAAEASSSVCRQLYEKRLAEINGELRRLEQARAFLEERLELEEAKADFSRPVGIPLAALNWLVCPDCRESLVLESDQIRSGQIISGALTCPHCGRVLPVEEGILMVSPAPDAHKNFSSFDSSIQPECRGYLYEEAILSNLKKLGYAIRERYRMDFTTPLQATNPFMNDRDQMYRLWLYLEKQR